MSMTLRFRNNSNENRYKSTTKANNLKTWMFLFRDISLSELICPVPFNINVWFIFMVGEKVTWPS